MNKLAEALRRVKNSSFMKSPDLPQVDVTYTGSEDLASLAPLDWTEIVTSSVTPGVVCNTGATPQHDNPGTSSVRVVVDLTAWPPTGSDGTAAVYTVEITFTDPNYGQTGDYKIAVTGTPPQ